MSRDPTASDVEAEQEIDFSRYWNAILARLWLPLAGIAVGLALGYLATLGNHTVYQAEAVVYLGQPLAPNGALPLQSLATNPSTTREIVGSASALREAARISGLPFSSLRGHVSTIAVANASAKKSATGATPLVRIRVTGSSAPQKIAAASNALAKRVVHSVSGYADLKIKTFTAQLDGENEALASINVHAQALNDALKSGGSTSLEKLVLISQEDITEQRRAVLLEQRATTQQLLAIAQAVERSRIVTPASAVNTTARSIRSSLLVGALIGLIVGLAAALLWDPLVARRRAS
jgi:hypothetical protein